MTERDLITASGDRVPDQPDSPATMAAGKSSQLAPNSLTHRREQGLRLLRQILRTLTRLIMLAAAGACRIAKSLYLQTEDWVLDAKRATFGLAVTRILLGITMLGFLATNFTTRHYTFGAGMAWSGQYEPGASSDFINIWPFGIFHATAQNPLLFTCVYLLAAAAAATFIIGWRTKFSLVALFMLWVGIVEANDFVSDQSDNLVRIVMMIMFFTACADRWSLDARRRRKYADNPGQNFLTRWWRFQRVAPDWVTNLFHNLGIVALAAQVSFIYVSGGLYKAGGAPWSGGTAIYDPIHTAQFGPWPELSALVTAWAPAVAFATILTLLVQISFPLLLLRRGTRIFGLITMLAFHLGIAVLMGLPWFSLAMIAVDSIFIRDRTWQGMAQGLNRIWISVAPNRVLSPT